MDRRRLPGRFLLTGSANVLLVPKLSESLAGRMGILRIHPLAQCEIAASECRFLEDLFAGSFKTAKAERLGRSLLETFVFQELRRQASWQEKSIRFYHFRDKYNHEVDIVLERGAHEIAGVEVKASATVTASDFRGLRKFRDTVKKGFVSGVILYDGETCVSFGDDLFAVPLRLLWETP